MSILLRSLLLTVFSIVVSSSVTKHGGFSAKLYRRDFLGSPSYDSTLSLTERVRKAVDRSIARYNYSAAITQNSLEAEIKYHKGEYLMKIALGTPPVKLFGLLDTGSALTWMQCQPIAQNAPLFDPRESSTYKKFDCIDGLDSCPSHIEANDCKNNVCTYAYEYADGSKISGDLSTDMLTMESTEGEPVKQENFLFGCGHEKKGKFSEEASGIIGLGRASRRSLVHQLEDKIERKFSYCLVPNLAGSEGTSTINFGENAMLPAYGGVSTPLVFKNDGTPYYHATLEALTIAGKRVEFSSTSGNTIVDSGSTLNEYPKVFYNKVLRTFAKHINAKPIKDPDGDFPLCYEYGGFVVPEVIANFAGGADISLKFNNLFIRTRNLACLAVAKTRKDNANEATWGSTAQINFLIGFDMEDNTLSFMAVNCEDM